MRVALLGYGVAGAVFHGPLLAAADGCEVATVVTRSPARAAAARHAHPGVRIVADPAQVWAAAGEHDLVVVATPNDSHAPLALAAIEAGLAVVVDKPLAPTAALARGVLAAAAAAGVPLTVFQNRRWDGDLRTLEALLAAGTLGQVARLESRFERWRPRLRPDAWRETTPAAEGGGLLLDLGSHLVDQVLHLWDAPAQVYAELDARRPGVAAEDDVFLALGWPDGRRAHLWASAVAADLGPRFRVLGSQGAFVVPGLDGQEDQLRTGMDPRDPAFGVTPAERAGVLTDSAGEARALGLERGRYDAFYPAVRDALAHGAPLPVDPADAVRVLDILERARRSSATGAPVALPAP